MLWVVIRIDHPCLSIISHLMPVVGERRSEDRLEKRKGEKTETERGKKEKGRDRHHNGPLSPQFPFPYYGLSNNPQTREERMATGF